MEPIILPHQKRISFWQILFYISMGIVALWLILKSIGVIQTPFWLEYGIPIGGFIMGFLSVYQNLFDGIKNLSVGFATLTVKVDHLEKDMGLVKHDVGSLKGDVSTLKIDVGVLKDDVGLVKKKLKL